MSQTISFPSSRTIMDTLAKQDWLNEPYFQEKGVTKAVAELAAARFANRDVASAGVDMGVMLMMYDLQTGSDGFTGQTLPNLGKLGLPAIVWSQLTMMLKETLLECAEVMDTEKDDAESCSSLLEQNRDIQENSSEISETSTQDLR